LSVVHVLQKLEFQHSCLSDQRLSAIGVGVARQINDDTIISLLLNHRLGNTQTVNTVANDLNCPVNRPVFGGLIKFLGLHPQDNVNSSLQIKSESDGTLLKFQHLSGVALLHRQLVFFTHGPQFECVPEGKTGDDNQNQRQTNTPFLLGHTKSFPVVS